MRLDVRWLVSLGYLESLEQVSTAVHSNIIVRLLGTAGIPFNLAPIVVDHEGQWGDTMPNDRTQFLDRKLS